VAVEGFAVRRRNDSSASESRTAIAAEERKRIKR
jgi:hypothetical protein